MLSQAGRVAEDLFCPEPIVLIENGFKIFYDRDGFRIYRTVQINGSGRAEIDMTLPDFAGEELDI